jgi:uncharacterized membrane protein YeaQ/YmgE (transglycosylase-associated protein family)
VPRAPYLVALLYEPEEVEMESMGLMDMGGGTGIVMKIVIGGLAGWIAEKITKSDMGLIMNVIVGLVGAFIGGIIANAAGLHQTMFGGMSFWGNLLISVLGAVLLIYAVRMLKGRSA